LATAASTHCHPGAGCHALPATLQPWLATMTATAKRTGEKALSALSCSTLAAGQISSTAASPESTFASRPQTLKAQPSVQALP